MNTAEFLKKRAPKSATECEEILGVMKRSGHGWTILEMAERTGMASSTVVARFHDLIKAGEVAIAPFKRECQINHIAKKVYQVARKTKAKQSKDEQTGLFA
jgi:DNA-binding IclR family transcriptional regulator